MADLTLAAAVAVLSGASGVLATLYARGRADGHRDHVIEDHDRRLASGANRMDRIEEAARDHADRASRGDQAVARLEAKVDALKESLDELRADVRQLVSRNLTEERR